MEKSMIVQGSINLSKINDDNIFITAEGEKLLNIRVTIYPQTDKREFDGMVAQKFLKKNTKDSQGNWIKTPILGNLRITRNFIYEDK